MGGRNSLAWAVERKCAIRSLLDQYDVDAYMRSFDPEKVQKLRDVVFPWVGRRRNIVAVEVLARGLSLRGEERTCQGNANLFAVSGYKRGEALWIY